MRSQEREAATTPGGRGDSDGPSVTEESDKAGASLAQCLNALGLQDHELLSVGMKRQGGRFQGSQRTVAELKDWDLATVADADVWVGLQPMRRGAKRGTAEDVVRIAVLFADLDIGAGKMPTDKACLDVINTLTSLLGTPPVYVVFSGHGYQPAFAVDLKDSSDLDRMKPLLDRWGQLVKQVAVQLGGSADSVFDAARILRVPGTINWKDPAAPVHTSALLTDGRTLTADQIEKTLDDHLRDELLGHEDGREEDLGNDVPFEDASEPASSCPYAQTMIAAWVTDLPEERHPWAVKGAMKLVCLKRLGCITTKEFNNGIDVLVTRMTWLCQHHGKPRDFSRTEVIGKPDSAIDSAIRKAAGYSNATLWKKVGNHNADGPHFATTPSDPPPLDVTNQAIANRHLRLQLGTGPTAGVFARAGQLVYTPHVDDDGYRPLGSGDDGDSEYQVRPMSGIRLAAELDHRYAVFRMDKDGAKAPALTPLSVCNRLVAAPENAPKVRKLTAVTRTPFARPDWTICTRPGYDEATGVLYLPRGNELIRVPSIPTGKDVRDAVHLLLRLVGDFPWNSDNDRANYLAGLIWPTIVQTLPEVLPPLLITAHQPGSGKTLLARILLKLHDGTQRAEWPSGKDEQEKELAAIFTANTGGLVVFDNVRGTLQSSVLESLLTTRTTSVRRLGTNDERLPVVNDRLICFTGNNISIGGDLPRRVVWASIDPDMPHPETRGGFAIPGDLAQWVVANRPQLLSAILTLVAHWVAEGRPVRSSRSDSFAASIDPAQGFLACAGISGTVAADESNPLSGRDDDEWSKWYAALHRRFGDEPFRAHDILAALDTGEASPGSPLDRAVWDALPDEISVRRCKDGGLTSRSLGMFFKHRNGRYFGDYAVKLIPDKAAGNSYRIHRYEQGRS